MSSTLRGCLSFDLTIIAFSENLHSGYSGIVPDPYFIGMTLLSLIVDFKTQKVIPEFEVEIPKYRIEECEHASTVLPEFFTMSHALEGVKPRNYEKPDTKFQQILNSTWLP